MAPMDLPPLSDVFVYQFLRFLDPRESYCVAYLAGGVLFTVGVALWRRRARSHIRLREILHLFGSRKLWLHRSTRLDVKLYLMHGVLLMAGYGLF